MIKNARIAWVYNEEFREKAIEACQHIINHASTESEEAVNLAQDYKNVLEEFTRLLERHRQLAEKVPPQRNKPLPIINPFQG